jgi:Uma2 family endonuclease
MSTVLKLGPADHGRAMTFDEFLAGDYQEGHKYELINGRLYVSPQANFPENFVEAWVLAELTGYSREHPEVINFVTNKARVFVPQPTDVTAPEPDVAAYADCPLERWREVRWQDVSPILVIEVLSAEGPEKDTDRNAALYLQVPSIKEYWIFDARDEEKGLKLIRHRRHGKKWQIKELKAGETYTTKLLPGFELVLRPE